MRVQSSDARLVVLNGENGYPLQEVLDRAGSGSINTLNRRYLNNAGQGSVLQQGSSAGSSSVTGNSGGSDSPTNDSPTNDSPTNDGEGD